MKNNFSLKVSVTLYFLILFFLLIISKSVSADVLSQQLNSSTITGTPYGDVFTELENVTSGSLGSITVKYDIRSGTNVPVRLVLFGYTDNTRSTLCTAGSAGSSDWGGSMRVTH